MKTGNHYSIICKKERTPRAAPLIARSFLKNDPVWFLVRKNSLPVREENFFGPGNCLQFKPLRLELPLLPELLLQRELQLPQEQQLFLLPQGRARLHPRGRRSPGW